MQGLVAALSSTCGGVLTLLHERHACARLATALAPADTDNGADAAAAVAPLDTPGAPQAALAAHLLRFDAAAGALHGARVAGGGDAAAAMRALLMLADHTDGARVRVHIVSSS